MNLPTLRWREPDAAEAEAEKVVNLNPPPTRGWREPDAAEAEAEKAERNAAYGKHAQAEAERDAMFRECDRDFEADYARAVEARATLAARVVRLEQELGDYKRRNAALREAIAKYL